MTNAATPRAAASKGLNFGLWAVQVVLGLMFVGTGLWKAATPIPELAAKMPWMGQVSPTFLYITALFDALGGVGILLPSVTRIKPGLAVLGALGCAALMVGSVVVFAIDPGNIERPKQRRVQVGISATAAYMVVRW